MPMRTLRLSIALGIVLALPPWAAGEEAQSHRVAFEIQQQPLGAALKAFARQAGVQILNRDEEVSLAGMMAPAVSGEMSVREALEKLLEHSGLTYRFVNAKTVRVSAARVGRENNEGESHQESLARLAQGDGAPDSSSSASGETA